MVTDIIRLVVTHNAGEVNECYRDLWPVDMAQYSGLCDAQRWCDQVSEMKIGRLLFWMKKSVPAVLALILLGCEANHKNVCPIDGQPPEWSGQRRGKSCEYFHYSIVEKNTHSWWAECSARQ
jgi:hypothetical protein